ncbi:hypothetical protein I4I84_18710 [Pseudonocardia sp. KRD-182]|uniref:ClpX C4-type zinc finger protein n=1 Tax=Pseudonocardia oceani TaxID=2792013 RepID=UPI001C4A3F8B|nr:ClpX C4-type zinc finger protein [Pseudonocardia oceani]MBW0110753.1 hypothetical protein [Pseudonocardia oceani]
MTATEPSPIQYGTLRCSFCRLDRTAVVAGATPGLAICAACVRLCTEILTTEGRLDDE